jgi:hypothetical protein
LAKKLDDAYNIERFTREQLIKMQDSLYDYAQAIDGLPKNHSEVFQKRGWLVPFLMAYDDLLSGRWSYWLDLVQKNSIVGSGPIPQLDWVSINGPRYNRGKKMLDTCLSNHNATIDSFADWLLWGLAGSNQLDRVSEELNKFYYEKFDLFLLLDNPADYFSNVLADQTGSGYKGALGYFPTPSSITTLLSQITLGNQDPEEMKRQTINDCCVGCGAMLLPASNYVFRAYAQDVSGIAVKLCKIQFILYAPWFAMPREGMLGFDEQPNLIIDNPAINENLLWDWMQEAAATKEE